MTLREFDAAAREARRELVLEALAASGWNVRAAAAALGCRPDTLYRMLRLRCGITGATMRQERAATHLRKAGG